MRDILVTIIVFGSIPYIFSKPYIGILMWSWLGYMNPHRLTWGFAYDMPFAQIVGIATLISIVFSKEPKRLPKNGAVIVLVLLNIWMLVTTIFAFYPSSAWSLASKVYKIQLMIFIIMMVMNSKDRIISMVWVLTGSLAFYGIKGGIYTILRGGEGMVLGPGGFITGNTEIALTLIMILPMIWFLYHHSENIWIKRGLLITAILTAFAIVGTYSRGGLVAGFAMAFFLWWKSRKKAVLGVAVLLLIPLLLFFMPEQWSSKMGTIETYEQDSSAMGRINAWWFAFNLTKDYPLTGCGFDCFSPSLFQIYAPDPLDFHDSHSIYFQMLGHHGYVGLILFLLFYILSWRIGSHIIKKSKNKIEWLWANGLASMIQVSLVGYAVGGAFLGLAYFDLPFHFAAILILIDQVLKNSQKEENKLEKSVRQQSL